MIDKPKMIELASDPDQTTASIAEGLGFSSAANLYYELNKDAGLKDTYAAARREATTKRQSGKTSSKGTRRGATPPPAMGMPRAA